MVIILIILIIGLPLVYILIDRTKTPTHPSWLPPNLSPPTQKWEQIANDFLKTQTNPNALQYYLTALSLSQIDNNLSGTHHPLLKSISTILNQGWNQSYPDVEYFLNQNQSAIQEIIKGAQLQHCEYPSLQVSAASPLPPIFKFQILGRLLAIGGKKLEKNQQYSEAMKNYLYGIQFGKDIGAGTKGQELITRLIGIDIIGVNEKCLIKLIESNKLSESDYRMIIQELDRIEREHIPFSDAIETDVQKNYSTIFYITQNPIECASLFTHSRNNKIFLEIAMNSGYITLNRGRLLQDNYDFMNEVISSVTTKSYRDFVQIDWDNRYPRNWAEINFVPPFANHYTRHMIEITLLRLAQIQSAIHLFHLKNKKYPKSLEDLKPDYFSTIPLDPFIDQPFHYTQDSTGAFAYSVGPDFKDDSARVIYDPSNGTMSTGDIRP